MITNIHFKLQVMKHVRYKIGGKNFNLTFKSLRFTLCTARFNIQKFFVLPKLHLCVLRGSQSKELFFLYTALTYQFL